MIFYILCRVWSRASISVPTSPLEHCVLQAPVAHGFLVYQRRLQKDHKKFICLRIWRVIFGLKDKVAIISPSFRYLQNRPPCQCRELGMVERHRLTQLVWGVRHGGLTCALMMTVPWLVMKVTISGNWFRCPDFLSTRLSPLETWLPFFCPQNQPQIPSSNLMEID